MSLSDSFDTSLPSVKDRLNARGVVETQQNADLYFVDSGRNHGSCDVQTLGAIT